MQQVNEITLVKSTTRTITTYICAKVASKTISFKRIWMSPNFQVIPEIPTITMWNTSISETNDMPNCSSNSDYPLSKSTNWLVALAFLYPFSNLCLLFLGYYSKARTSIQMLTNHRNKGAQNHSKLILLNNY